MNNTNRAAQLTEEELAAIAAEHRAAANGALLRARAARSAALMAAAGAPGLLQPTGLTGDALNNSWINSLQQQHQRQQQAAAAVLQNARNPLPGTSNVNTIPLRTSGAEDVNSKGSIPIGFFRDPRGNAWAASLQHPNRQANQQTSLFGNLQEQESALVALQATQIAQNPIVNLPKNSGLREVIEIDDDSDDELKPSNEIANSSLAPEQTKTIDTTENKRVSKTANSIEFKDNRPSLTQQDESISIRGPGTLEKAETGVALQHALVPAPAPSLKATKKTTIEKTTRASQKGVSTAHAGIKGIAGPFTQKWMMLQVPAVDRNREVRECIKKIIYVATGLTETSPDHMFLPPDEVVLDVEKLTGLATELIEERHQAIGNAIREAYTEMKSRHDQISMRHDSGAMQENSKREIEQKVEMKWGAKMKALTENCIIEKENAKKKSIEINQRLMQQVKDLKKELKLANEKLEISQNSQEKTVDTLMKASVMSLRMLQKKRKYGQ